MEEKIKNLKERLKSMGKVSKCLLTIAGIAVVVTVILLVVFSGTGKTTFDISTTLKEVVEISNVYTAEYTYNSIASVANEKEIKYYVSYKGVAKTGFDFEKLNVFETREKIFVVIPEISVSEVSVDEESLDFIFTKNKYNKEAIYHEAYAACCSDLQTDAEQNATLQKMAIESAVDAISGLVKPFEKQLNNGMIIEVVYIDEYNKGVVQ